MRAIRCFRIRLSVISSLVPHPVVVFASPHTVNHEDSLGAVKTNRHRRTSCTSVVACGRGGVLLANLYTGAHDPAECHLALW